jgi:hypothetical protein
MRARRLVLVVAAAAALSGCGSGGDGGGAGGGTASAKQAVAGALAKTEATSALVSVDVLARRGGETLEHYSEEGSIHRSGGRLDIDRRPLGGALTHEIFLRGRNKLVLYLSPSPTPLRKGKRWLAVDLIRYGRERYGAETTAFVSADREPLEPARLLASPVAKVSDLGTDSIGPNIAARHYRGTVNVIAAGRAAGVKGAGLRTLAADMGRVTQTIDVWVNTQGRIVQLVVSAPQPTAGKGVTLRETVQLRDFGAGGRVKAPPARLTQSFYPSRK